MAHVHCEGHIWSMQSPALLWWTLHLSMKKNQSLLCLYLKKNRGHSLNLERHLVWVGSISLCLCVSIPIWACVLMWVGVFVLSTCTVYLRIDALVEGALKVSSQTCYIKRTAYLEVNTQECISPEGQRVTHRTVGRDHFLSSCMCSCICVWMGGLVGG